MYASVWGVGDGVDLTVVISEPCLGLLTRLGEHRYLDIAGAAPDNAVICSSASGCMYLVFM